MVRTGFGPRSAVNQKDVSRSRRGKQEETGPAQRQGSVQGFALVDFGGAAAEAGYDRLCGFIIEGDPANHGEAEPRQNPRWTPILPQSRAKGENRANAGVLRVV